MSTASAKPTPQILLRRVALWDRQEAEEGVCAECSLSRLLTFYAAYDWEPGASRELFALCDSCGLDLLTRSKALEAQPAEERTALEAENLHLMMLVERVANTLRTSLPSLIHPEDWGEFREAGWEPLQNLLNELDTLQGEKFPEIDAQERAGAKAISEQEGT